MSVGAALFVAAVWPGAAQSVDRQRALCENRNDAAASDLALDACVSLLKGGARGDEALAAAHRDRGRLYARRKSYDLAIADFDEAIRLGRKDRDVYAARGEAHLNRNEFDPAISDFDEAIRLDPRLPGLFINRGLALAHKGALDAAIADFTLALSLDPANASTFARRAAAFTARGDKARNDYQSAIDDFDTATRLNPNDANAQNGACWARAVANRELKQARAACDAALRLSKKNPNYLDSRGLVGLRQSRFAEAWADYVAAEIDEPLVADHLYGRGIAALRMKRAEEGRANIALALAMDPKVAAKFASYGIKP